jgi:small-conductance mechanosensitive channel
MSENVNHNPGASSPDPAKLVPEAVIAQLRSMRSQIEDAAPLSKEQRALIKQRIRRQPKSVVESAINVIGVLDNVSQAIGQPLDEVRQLQDDELRWDAMADEARAFLKDIEGAILNRRYRLALIGMQVYAIGTQLAKDPARALLVPHVEEVKRLKGLSRRKKSKQAAQTQTPAPAPIHDTSHVTQSVE